MEAKLCSRFYRSGAVVPFEEDKTHEFKAHKNICVEDLPHWAFIKGTMRRSRRAISRTLNGFLNTGIGGTVYIGVLDDGVVKGLQLTVQQKDHLRLAVEDVLSRYRPTVTASRFEVEFVPVLESEVLLSSPASLDDSGYTSSGGSGDGGGEDSPTPPSLSDHCGRVKSKLQLYSHKLRSPTLCWCDQEALAAINKGEKIPRYVAEVTVHPFKYRQNVDPTVLQLHPVYEDEEGRVYMRGSASLHKMTYQEVAQMTERQASDHFDKVLKGLREELVKCGKELVNQYK